MPCLVWSPKSCVTAAQCSCTRMMHWKAKVTSKLTDVWQQLFEQQDITAICTIHFHDDAWKPDQCTRAWRHRLKPTCRNMFIRNQCEGRHELKQHLTETWSATNRASLIKQLQDCCNAQAKSKHWTFARMFLCNCMSWLLKHILLTLWTNWLMFHFTR